MIERKVNGTAPPVRSRPSEIIMTPGTSSARPTIALACTLIGDPSPMVGAKPRPSALPASVPETMPTQLRTSQNVGLKARAAGRAPALYDLLRAGGIYTRLQPRCRDDALSDLAARVPGLSSCQRTDMLRELMAREDLGSTAIGDGLAVPHLRAGAAVEQREASVTLCLLERSVDFGAPDGQRVHGLFFVMGPSATTHLQVLARLGAALRDDSLCRLLRKGAGATLILERVAVIEGRA
jgi:mannitol/fructose-specific phosphotransferase system IIA component (Ntr-type)